MLTIDTQAAENAAGSNRSVATMFDHYPGVPVTGLGGTAKIFDPPTGGTFVFVLTGTTLLQLSAVDVYAPNELMEHLVSLAVERLPRYAQA